MNNRHVSLLDALALNRPIRNWNGQRVWIVGASSGIGAALADQLMTGGAHVILSARRADALEKLVTEAGHPAGALVVPFDVADTSAWGPAYEQIVRALGGVDLVVFCAAQYVPERVWDVTPARAQHTLQVNLASVYSGMATVLPDMLARANGGIALVASVAGYMGLPGASVYGPGKAALINLAEILYTDLHPRGLNVYLVNPGFVDTGLTRKNSFVMPALQTTQQAATAILRGVAAGQFEIHFPRRFTQVLKLVSMLPYRWRFFLFKRVFHGTT